MRKKINIVLVLITTLLVSAGFAPVGSAQTVLPDIGRSLPAHHPHPFVQGILNQVDIGVAYEYLRDLTGEQAAIIEGQPYTIITRHTDSGEPVEKATQYVAEHLDALGLAVELHTWQDGRPPNVIAEIPGETHPEEIFIICAHLDDMPGGGVAPGADDNASGVAAVLVAADVLSRYRWDSTLRFALWTGEEQGVLGSIAYAERAYNVGEEIAGVLNLDMIGYNSKGSSPDIDLHACRNVAYSLSYAYLFVNVIDAYGLDLVPQVFGYCVEYSDHASFWMYDYPAILGIEDDDDFNPYYHTIQDTILKMDKTYYGDFVRAAVGTFAHMVGGPVIDPATFFYAPLILEG